jgi:hypothetical protein
MRRLGTIFHVVLTVVLGLSVSSVSAVTPISPGDILVAAQGPPGTIHHFSSSGADLGIFATNELQAFSWMTIDASGNVYASELQVDKFSPSGVQLMTIATTPSAPGGLAIGADGSIYVGSSIGGVNKFSASGQPLGKFSTLGGDFLAFDAQDNLFAPYFPTAEIYRIASTGTGEIFAGLPGAEGIAFDRAGNVYVSSYSLNIVEVFSPSGLDLGVFASANLNQPYGLAFDAHGNLYVANWGEGTVRRLSPSGEDLGVFASGLNRPRDIVVVPGPVIKDQCRNGGWETFEFPRTFRNQGDCISFVETGR